MNIKISNLAKNIELNELHENSPSIIFKCNCDIYASEFLEKNNEPLTLIHDDSLNKNNIKINQFRENWQFTTPYYNFKLIEPRCEFNIENKKLLIYNDNTNNSFDLSEGPASCSTYINNEYVGEAICGGAPLEWSLPSFKTNDAYSFSVFFYVKNNPIRKTSGSSTFIYYPQGASNAIRLNYPDIIKINYRDISVKNRNGFPCILVIMNDKNIKIKNIEIGESEKYIDGLLPNTYYNCYFKSNKSDYLDSFIIPFTTKQLPKLSSPKWSSPTYHSLYCENTNDVEVFLNYRSSGGTWKSISLTKGNHLIDKLNKTTTYEGYFSKNNDYLNSNTTSATTLDWEKLEAPYFNSIAQRAACCQNNNPVDVTLYLKNISTNQISTYNVNTKQNLLLTLLIGTKYSGYFTASEWYSSDERSFTTIDHYKLEPPGLSTPTQHTIVCYNPNGGTATLVLVESVTKITTTYSVSYGQNTITGLKHNTRYKGKLTRNDWYDSDESDEICTLDLVRLSTPTFSNASQHSITCNNPNNVSATLHISGFGFDKTYSVSYGDNSITGLPANTSFTAYLTADDYHASYEGKFSTLDLIKLISPEYRSISQTGGLCYNGNSVPVVLHLSGGKTEDITVDSKTTASLGSLSVKTSYSGYFTTANENYVKSDTSSFTTMDWPTLSAPTLSNATQHTIVCYNPNGGTATLVLVESVTKITTTYSVSYGSNTISGLKYNTRYKGKLTRHNYYDSDESDEICTLDLVRLSTPTFSGASQYYVTCNNPNNVSATLHISGFGFDKTYSVSYGDNLIDGLPANTSFTAYLTADDYHASYEGKFSTLDLIKLISPEYRSISQTGGLCYNDNNIAVVLHLSGGKTEDITVDSKTTASLGSLSVKTSYSGYFTTANNRYRQSSSSSFTTMDWPTLDAPIFSEETYCSVSCFNPNGNVILNLKNNATGSVSTYSVSYGPNAIDGLSETTSYSGWFSSKNSTAYNSSSISFTTAAMPQIQYAPKFSALGTSTANCTNNNSFSVTLHIPGAFPATYNINAYSTIGVKNLRQSYSYQTYFSASGYKNSGTTVLKINPPPKKKLAAPSFSGATQTSITVVHINGVNPDLIVKNGNTQVVRKRILSSTPTLVSGLTAGTSYTAYFVLSGWENSDSVPFSTLSAPVES